MHIEELKDLKCSSVWLTQDMKTNNYLLKVPLDIWINGKKKTEMKKLSLWEDRVGHPLKTSYKNEASTSLLEKVVPWVGLVRQMNIQLGTRELIGPDDPTLRTITFAANHLSTFSLKILSVKTPLYWLAQNGAWEREIIGRQLIWASSSLSPRGHILLSCQVGPGCCLSHWPEHPHSVPLTKSSDTCPSSASPLEARGTEHKVHCLLCFLDILKHLCFLLPLF